MARHPLEVADIVRAHRAELQEARGGELPAAESRVLRDIASCRTEILGGHVERCDQCGHERIAYNSCRNRHCPKCLQGARQAWLAARESELLPVEYFHVVFTIPQELALIAFHNKKLVYKLLMRTAADTLLKIGADPKHLGAKLGVLAILHTWGQNLQHHPHVHCVVTGGGIAPDGERWIACRPGFFLPVRILSRVFRGKFLAALKRAHARGALVFHGKLAALEDAANFRGYLAPLREKNWVVYAKRPFGGPARVLKYLGRYTHRVAISNQRLVAMEDGHVSFVWKDYAHDCRRRVLKLTCVEFLRRFLMHVLPKGFVRIRHYGVFANRKRQEKLERCRTLIDAQRETPEPSSSSTAPSEHRRTCGACPICAVGAMMFFGLVERNQLRHIQAAVAVVDTS